MRFVLFALALALPACIDSRDIDGSGRLVEVRREVGPFGAVEVADGLRADVRIGDTDVTMHLDDNIVDRVRVEVRGDVLVLEAKEPNIGFDPSAGAVIRVSSPTIEGVTVRDGSDARAEARGAHFTANSHDGAHLVLEGQDAAKIRASASDGSRIEIRGAVRELDIDASDGSKVVSEAPSEVVAVRTRDGSTVRAHASRSARVEASDGSRVQILGRPTERDVTMRDGSSVAFPD